jgi:CRP-like cAMP-binding protein
MVRKLALRSPLSDTEQRVLLGLPRHLARLDRSSYLVREGDAPAACAVLLSGFAYRNKIAGDGGRQILSVHLQGDLLDLQNCLLPVADHSVQALTRIQVAYIPYQALLAAAGNYPAIAQALLHDTLVDGSIFREWILNVGRRDARQRIAHLLCELAMRQEAAGLCKGPEYEWPMTQAEIADAAGLTTVHVNRTLQSMRSDGLISTSTGRVAILDWPGLQAAGDFTPTYLHQPATSSAQFPSTAFQQPASMQPALSRYVS